MISGFFVLRLTSNRWSAGLAFIVASIVNPLHFELGHPKSLCSLYVMVILTGVTFFNQGKWRWMGALMSGTALALLGMTKINLGAFATFGLFTPVLVHWAAGSTPRKILAILIITAIPAWLIKPIWPMDDRLITGGAMLLPLWVMLIFRQGGNGEKGRRYRNYDCMALVSVLVAGGVTLVVAGSSP